MYRILFFVLLLKMLPLQAQRPDQHITRDTLMGWTYRNSPLKARPATATTTEGRLYSGRQIALTDTFQKWIQQSFIPRSETYWVVKSPQALREDRSGLLHTYGVDFFGAPATYHTYRKGMYTNYEGGLAMRLSANSIPGQFLEPLSTPEELVFLGPPPVYPNRDRNRSADDDLLNDTLVHPNVYRYPTWHSDRYDYTIEQTILLTRDNRSPFRPLRYAEYFERLERYLQTGKEANSAERLEALRRVRSEHPEWSGEIARVPDDVSRVYDPQSLTRIFALDQNGYCLYALPRSQVALSKKDEPLWLTFYLKWSRFDIRQQHRFQSIMEQFDFEYVRRYFFDPASVRGRGYRPLREPLRALPAKQYVGERSAAMRKAAADPSVLFSDDFSGNADGKEPVGWFATAFNTSALTDTCHVTSLPDRKAVIIRGKNLLVPFAAPPLSGNFSIRFDLECNPEYGSYPLHFYLTDNKDYSSFISENYSMPDFVKRSNGNGLWFTIEPRRANNNDLVFYFYHPGIANEYNRYSRGTGIVIDDFDPMNTRARFELAVRGDELTLKVNGREVIRERNRVLPGTTFRTLGWVISGSARPADRFYLSDVLIRKE